MNLHKYIYQQYDSSHKSPTKIIAKISTTNSNAKLRQLLTHKTDQSNVTYQSSLHTDRTIRLVR